MRGTRLQCVGPPVWLLQVLMDMYMKASECSVEQQNNLSFTLRAQHVGPFFLTKVVPHISWLYMDWEEQWSTVMLSRWVLHAGLLCLHDQSLHRCCLLPRHCQA